MLQDISSSLLWYVDFRIVLKLPQATREIVGLKRVKNSHCCTWFPAVARKGLDVTNSAYNHIKSVWHLSYMFFSRPMTPSPISAKQQTSSFSPWWSGRKGSRTSPSSPSMTRSSYYEQVDAQTQTSACGKLMLTQISDHTLIHSSFLQG